MYKSRLITPSEIELSLDAMQHNLSFIKKFVKKNVKISSVIKGNAYGHGIEVYVPAAEECGIDHFAVLVSTKRSVQHKLSVRKPN